MKILFVAPNYLPHIGGVERHLEQLCKALLSDKHQITILMLQKDPDTRPYEKKGDLEIIRLPKSSSSIYNRWRSASYFWREYKKFSTYEIIHFHDFNTFYTFGLPAYPLFKLLGKRCFLTFHGWEGDVPPLPRVIQKRRFAAKCCSANMAIGDFIEKWYGTKADVVSYGGVNLPDQQAKATKGELLFVGRLAEDTGILEYLKAWEVIVKRLPEHRFVLCGDGPLRNTLETYVTKNKIPNVIFEGFVEDVDPYLAEAEVVFTSGYLGILEAFSHKKNVIALYDNPLKKDYLMMIPEQKEMMWVVNNERDNIIAALDEAFTDREKQKVAYLYAQDHSWQKVKEDYYRLWRL